MRLDGCFFQGDEGEKFKFLRKLQSLGVKNIEMECTGFAAMTQRAGVRGYLQYPSLTLTSSLAAIVCVSLVNRMDGDQVRIKKELYTDFELRPFNIVAQYIINLIGSVPTESI